MLRTPVSKNWIKRPFRPLYGWTQMTPKATFLDPAWNRSVPMWPGMVYKKTLGDNVSPISAVSDIPYGFGALYVGGDGIDEPLDAGINTFAVWVMNRDAEAEVLAPAFDTTQTWTDPGDGSEVLIYVGTTGANQGMLVPAAAANHTTQPVARLIKVVSPTKIVIGGLR